MPETLTAAQARRVALAAQGFAVPRPTGRIDTRHLHRVLRRTGLLQIDSVNVLARAHYLPPYSRLGAYPASLLDRAAYSQRTLFEYWGHEASLLPVALHPLLRWRMERARNGVEGWQRVRRLATERPGFIGHVLDAVRDRGPLGAGALREGPRGGSGWWAWDDAKVALEYLFWSGQVTTAGRRGFERMYDVTERVLPAAVLDLPTPDTATAQRELVALAARAHGVATEPDLRDYFRLRPQEARAAVAALVEAGTLVPVEVAGWPSPAYLHVEAKLPRKVAARALIAPFDPLVFTRERTERLFGMRYRIEIYVPAGQRVHGYYVLPFLLDEELTARVDLKADRATGRLRVQAAHLQPGHDPAYVAAHLAAELRVLAEWLGLTGITMAGVGDLAEPLARCVG